MLPQIVTLSHQIREDKQRHPEATGAFSSLLEHVGFAARLISREVNKAGLVDVLGLTGETNCQGEEVRKLDEFANDTLVEVLRHCRFLAGMASEEVEDFIPVAAEEPNDDEASSRYVIVFDPLDGSSNIDANVSIGTIFSILKKTSSGPTAESQDFLQEGFRQLAAGYIIYGSSTMLVYTTGNGVHGFTLDPSVGEFILSHPVIRAPRRGKIFSVNVGNIQSFDPSLQRYLAYLTSDKNAQGKPYSSRYIGSLVADFHRNLLYGGIFLYPADAKRGVGKLRLLYEANPLAFIAEQAGGRASNGQRDILTLKPSGLHERVPLLIGSADDVTEAESFLAGAQADDRRGVA